MEWVFINYTEVFVKWSYGNYIQNIFLVLVRLTAQNYDTIIY
jgi:hypothetical protein